MLFISIAATVTPASIRGLVLPTLGLVAMLVLVARPLVALLATRRTDLTKGERGFVGWMDPRGIVAHRPRRPSQPPWSRMGSAAPTRSCRSPSW